MVDCTRRAWLQGVGTSLAVASTGLGSTAWAQSTAQPSLVLGDQAGGLKALFEAAGTLEGAPFAWRWANFQGAAPLFEAHRSGAVDTAMAGDLPVLAAAVGKTPLKIVATRVGQPHPYADELCALFSADAVAERLCEELAIGSASRQPSRQP